MEIEFVTVDKDALDFLKVIYFGAITDPYEAAAFRAYRDFNRTLRFEKMEKAQRYDLRQQATEVLRQRITELNASNITSQAMFDDWHKGTCAMIRKPYCDAGIEFSWGQAQKWLNMTIKYLYIVGTCDFAGVFKYCHIPVDNYVFKIAKKELGVNIPKTAWSKWNDYDGQYLKYQKQLRSLIEGYDPLRWEFKYWMREARHHTEDE